MVTIVERTTPGSFKRVNLGQGPSGTASWSSTSTTPASLLALTPSMAATASFGGCLHQA